MNLFLYSQMLQRFIPVMIVNKYPEMNRARSTHLFQTYNCRSVIALDEPLKRRFLSFFGSIETILKIKAIYLRPYDEALAPSTGMPLVRICIVLLAVSRESTAWQTRSLQCCPYV